MAGAIGTKDVVPGNAYERKKRNPVVSFTIRLVREKPLGAIGAIIVLVLLITGIFANFLAPYGMSEVNLAVKLTPPGPQYIMGTDQIGRDILSRVIYGARTSMVVGVVGTALSMVISAIIGIASGFLSGRFDTLLQRFVDAWMCIPSLILIIVIISLLGPGMSQVIIVSALSLGIGGSRVVRSATIAIKEDVYVKASIAIGCPIWRILIQHILPNVMATLIVLFTTRLGTIILMEAMISFLGFGIPPPTPSWGGMISGASREYLLEGPWIVFWPGFFLSLVVYGVNMFGDALRDLLDPRLRGGVGGMGNRGMELARKALKKKHAGAENRPH